MTIEAVARDVHGEVCGRLGIITLNRAKALNALNLDMVRDIDALLADWAEDPAVDAVMIRSASDRAFCAGGDVRAIGILSDSRDREAAGRAFFGAEYRLNLRIARFPKPLIALMAGVVMGGGVGISVFGSHRIVAETVRMAMPETVLGLFPDVGASWFLNACPGAIGRYLALTGAALDAADALTARLATHHVPLERFATLTEALVGAAVLDLATIDAVVADHMLPLHGGTLADRRPIIDALFAAPDLDTVIARVDGSDAPWIDETATSLRRASPTSLRATWRRMSDGAGQSLETVLDEDYRMAVRMVAGHDFAEGVRAILVDKDHAPVWSPADLAAVHPAAIDALLAP